MSQTFAEVVERVKHLSSAEKEELLELLRKHDIDDPHKGNGVRRHMRHCQGSDFYVRRF
jgi:hypothetical protein